MFETLVRSWLLFEGLKGLDLNQAQLRSALALRETQRLPPNSKIHHVCEA